MLKISAEMFRQLQHLPKNVAPQDVIIDFEHGLTAALNQDYFVFLFWLVTPQNSLHKK